MGVDNKELAEVLINDRLRGRLDEVSLKDALEGILLRYHYMPDDEKEIVQKGDGWYIHDKGHSVFTYRDPKYGIRWHHYQQPEKNRRSIFQKGIGVRSLDDALSSIHTLGDN